MTEEKARDRRVVSKEEAEAAESERKLGHAVALYFPPLVLAAALFVGVLASVGPALLVLVAGALIGGIAMLWASLRTLGGDAPLSHELEALTVHTTSESDLAERKRTVLRALKDIEHEHAIGKIDDADYGALQAKYRADAKDVLRKLDLEVEPFREQAEAIARKHLEKVGLTGDASSEENVEAKKEEKPHARVCAKCATTNDEDAAFCKKCGAALEPAAARAEDAEEVEHA